MIFTFLRRAFLLPILFLILSSLCLAQEESLPYPGIYHIHSNISNQEENYPLRKIVSLAQDRGIKILIFTDTLLRRWEYGLPIFSNIFKISIQQDAVVKSGIKSYLRDLKKIKDEFPDMLILEGVEVTPFYWWSGNPFKKGLTLNDGNKHLLVVGLKNYQDYAHLPVVCNRYFLPQLKDLPPLLISMTLVILGILFLRKKKQRQFLGLALNIAGILFFLNFFPFSASRYNPYSGPKKFLPYQELINYVCKKGGLAFWAHPEVTELVSAGKFATINFYTPSYPEALMLTSGYTGFGVNISPGTNHDLILAGGAWDKVLKSYCEGKRNQPVWAIGEADYRGRGRIDSLQNIFFLHKFKPELAYEALRRGRLYVRYYLENKIDVSLSDFHIEDSQNTAGEFAFMGEEIRIKGRPRLHIKGNYAIYPSEDLSLEIIRNGEIIKELKLSEGGIFDLEFQDDSLGALDKKIYYRLNFFAFYPNIKN